MKRLLTIAGVLVALSAGAQQDMENVKIEPVPVADGLYMLVGAGGNIGLFAGEDGVFMIDDQFAELSPKIAAAVEELTGGTVDMLFNTHWHFDHVGGNEYFGSTGAQIFAHDNVRALMSEPQTLVRFGMNLPPAPEVALPIITFDDNMMFHINGDTVHARHVPNAHTSGDVILYFENANAVHTGDVYITLGYPFIDGEHGGHIDGLIDGARQVLDWADDETKIMPGHGHLSNRAEIREFHDMLVESRSRVQALLDEGRKAEEIVAANPLADLDERWSSGFIDGEGFTRAILEGLDGD